MGQEYKITTKTQITDASPIDFRLRLVPGFTSFDAQHDYHVFREPDNTGNLPNVVVKIERDGLYLCDFGSSNAIIGAIVLMLVAQFGELRIEDYER